MKKLRHISSSLTHEEHINIITSAAYASLTNNRTAFSNHIYETLRKLHLHETRRRMLSPDVKILYKKNYHKNEFNFFILVSLISLILVSLICNEVHPKMP